jgi:all-trans-retinol 13,14-reductase
MPSSSTSGLSTACILAKASRKVLILEQHDQAGGGLHTFIDKGYQFDVGVHYIGDIGDDGKQTMTKTLVDQITDGQLEWAPLEDAYDVVSIGMGEENRRYPVATYVENWKALLKKQFPDDHKGIDEFFKLMSEVGKTWSFKVMLKLLPLSVSWLMINMGVVYLLQKYYGGKYEKNTLEIIGELTDNKDLRTVMCYCWRDIGSPPSKTSFSTQASV